MPSEHYTCTADSGKNQRKHFNTEDIAPNTHTAKCSHVNSNCRKQRKSRSKQIHCRRMLIDDDSVVHSVRILSAAVVAVDLLYFRPVNSPRRMNHITSPHSSNIFTNSKFRATHSRSHTDKAFTLFHALALGPTWSHSQSLLIQFVFLSVIQLGSIYYCRK